MRWRPSVSIDCLCLVWVIHAIRAYPGMSGLPRERRVKPQPLPEHLPVFENHQRRLGLRRSLQLGGKRLQLLLPPLAGLSSVE
jgi:hypothetical protein